MPQFNVTVRRTETYFDEVVVEAESAEDAHRSIQEILDKEGWDEVFDDDGEYSECCSNITTVSEMEDA